MNLPVYHARLCREHNLQVIYNSNSRWKVCHDSTDEDYFSVHSTKVVAVCQSQREVELVIESYAFAMDVARNNMMETLNA